MTTERDAQLAAGNFPKELARFDAFVGVGVIPSKPNGDDMLVAVYVSQPPDQLPRTMLNSIPKYLSINPNSSAADVKTKIVNIGTLEP